MAKYKTVSLFGGIAADDKAWKELGIDTKKIDYVEIQPNRVRAYNALNPFRYKPQDVRGWNLKCDILVHGSPCQSFSKIGLREGGEKESGTQSSLMFETLRIIEEMGNWKPKFVVWENVKGVLDKTMRQPFEQYLEEMEMLGYTSNYEVLDARDFGIPHYRERVFCISILNGEEFDFDKLERTAMRPFNEFLEYSYHDKVPGQYLITIPSMLNKIAEINPVKPTDTYKRRLDEIVDFCYTITERQDRCPNAGYIKCAQGYRYLTELEVCRLLGYTDSDYKKLLKEFPSKSGKRNATIYALFGNSIVVDVLKSIFKLIESDNYAKENKSVKQLQLIC